MTAAIWVALVSGVLGFVIGVLNFFLSRAQLKHEQQQFEEQIRHQRQQLVHQQEQFDAQLSHQQQQLQYQREQFDAEFKLSREQMLLDHPDLARLEHAKLAAIQTIRSLYDDEDYKLRTFATIHHHLPDRSDEEIRSILRSMGAIRQNGLPERWRLPKNRP